MMQSAGFSVLLGLWLGAACRAADPPPAPTAPPTEWPTHVTFERLGVPPAELQQQQWNLGRTLPHDMRGKDVTTHTLAVKGPAGHGLTTEVYDLRRANVFYLHSDCGQGHADGVLGPFAGDPRQVLAATP